MKIYTKVEYQWDGKKYVVTDSEYYEYVGPIVSCTGAEEGAAAAGAKSAADAGVAGGVAGGTGLTMGTAGVTGLTIGEGATGLSAAAAGTGFDAGLAAAGVGAGAVGGDMFSSAGNSAATAANTGSASTVLGTMKDIATVASPIVSLVQAASGIAASKRMGVGAPGLTPPITMPIGGGPISFQAQQNSLASQLQRRGRASTILTDPNASGDKLGS